MAIYTKEEAKQLLDKALSYSKAETCEVNLTGNNSGNIRYARNTVSTAGYQNNQNMVIQSSFGNRVGVATLDEFTDEAIARAVKTSEELAKLAPENPEFMPPMGPQEYGESKEFFESTAKISPDYRADVATKSIEPARAKDVTAAGFLNDSANFSAMANSNGLFAYNQSTRLDFTVTMRTNDGTGSGWVTRDVNDADLFNGAEASAIAIDKALQSRNAKAIEPGKYTVILEPAASEQLLGNMFGSFNARTADEGRSFMSKEGGGTKLGEKIVDERVNIYSDPNHPLVPAPTWNGSGQAVKRMDGLKDGVVLNKKHLESVLTFQVWRFLFCMINMRE